MGFHIKPKLKMQSDHNYFIKTIGDKILHFACLKCLCLLTQGADKTATKWAIKTLTVCVASSDPARQQLLKSDKSER